MITEDLSFEDHTLKSYVDTTTGHIIKQDEYRVVRKSQKESGYRLVYLTNLKEYMLNFSITEWYILLDILENKVTSSFTLNVTYKDIKEEYKVSRTLAQQFLTKLKTIDIIRGNRGSYIVNPFTVLPYRVSDNDVAEAQRLWGSVDGESED